MSRPSIEKRVLPGNVRCRNRSNTSTCVRRSRRATGLIGSDGGAEAPAFGRVPQPVALFRDEHMRVVVTGRRAIHPAEGVDDVEHVRGGIRERRGNQRRRQVPEVLVGDVVGFGEERRIAAADPVPERIEPCGEVAVHANGLRQADGADDFLERDAVRDRLELGWRRPALEQGPGLGVHRGRVPAVLSYSSST